MECPFSLWGLLGASHVHLIGLSCASHAQFFAHSSPHGGVDHHELCSPIAQLRFPDRLLRVKAESDSVAEKWEAELNRAHMLKVNGPPVVVSKGITLTDSPSAKTAARQVRACPAMHRTFMRHAPCAMYAPCITSLRIPLVPCICAA